MTSAIVGSLSPTSSSSVFPKFSGSRAFKSTSSSMIRDLQIQSFDNDNDNSFYFQIHNDTYNITLFSNIASDLGNKETVEV